MKYAALIAGILLTNRLLIWLFPTAEEAGKYFILVAALFALFVVAVDEIKTSRTLVE